MRRRSSRTATPSRPTLASRQRKRRGRWRSCGRCCAACSQGNSGFAFTEVAMPNAKNLAELLEDIRAFRHYLQSERSLAQNTVLAYSRDLDRFANWVAASGLPDYLK